MANKPIIQQAQLTDENGVAAVSVATGGAVTVGPAAAGTSVTHVIRGASGANTNVTTARIESASGGSAAQDSAIALVQSTVDFTCTHKNATGNLELSRLGTAYGVVSNVGAWTLGPLTGSINHLINMPTDGNYLQLQGQGYSAYHVLNATAYTIGQNSVGRALRIGSGTNYMTVGMSLAAGGTSWGTYSDTRLKRDISSLSYGLNEIISINPIFFNYKVDEEGTQRRLGFKAQEIAQIIPEAVSEESGEDKYLSVASAEFTPVLVKAIQELSAKVDSLQAELNTLKGQ
jgi:hypothetical protein